MTVVARASIFRVLVRCALVMVSGVAATIVVGAQGGTDNGEWRAYAADSAATKYSPLDQITADNFGDLEVAWRWDSIDTHLSHVDELGRGSLVASDVVFDQLEVAEPGLWVTRPRTSRIVATPIMVDGRLFTSTAMSQVAAIDPASL